MRIKAFVEAFKEMNEARVSFFEEAKNWYRQAFYDAKQINDSLAGGEITLDDEEVYELLSSLVILAKFISVIDIHSKSLHWFNNRLKFAPHLFSSSNKAKAIHFARNSVDFGIGIKNEREEAIAQL